MRAKEWLGWESPHKELRFHFPLKLKSLSDAKIIYQNIYGGTQELIFMTYLPYNLLAIFLKSQVALTFSNKEKKQLIKSRGPTFDKR